MWFLADIFGRYTTNFAKACMRTALMEAEATRRALDGLRARRDRSDSLAAPQDVAGAEPVVPPTSDAVPAEAMASAEMSVPSVTPCADEPAAQVVAAATEAAPVAESAPVEAAPKPVAVGQMPMGVRGDVVVKWVNTFAESERRQMPELLEQLRKDKKVRVAELQMICAETLGERPQHRKKVEHLEVLRRHFAPAERARAPMAETMGLAAS